MFESRVRRALLAAGFLLAACGNTHAQSIGAATPPPDSTLYTTYSFSNDYTNVYLSVCGSTQQSFGCYGGATLGPFGRTGALIERDPVVNTQTQTVTRTSMWSMSRWRRWRQAIRLSEKRCGEPVIRYGHGQTDQYDRPAPAGRHPCQDHHGCQQAVPFHRNQQKPVRSACAKAKSGRHPGRLFTTDQCFGHHLGPIRLRHCDIRHGLG